MFCATFNFQTRSRQLMEKPLMIQKGNFFGVQAISAPIFKEF